MDEVTFRPIGTIYSEHKTLEGMPVQPSGAAGIKGQIELLPEFSEGLQDLEGFSHIILLYRFHRSSGFSLKVKPFLDNSERGLFSTRAPKRPNPIGLSIVKVTGVEGNIVHIENVDILDGTPLLDIKPNIPEFDHHPIERTGWFENAKGDVKTIRSDDRFTEAGAEAEG